MSSVSNYLPPSSLEEALTPLADLSPEQFDLLLRGISGPRSFSLGKADMEALQREIPALARLLPYTLQALAFLYGPTVSLTQGDLPTLEAVKVVTSQFLGSDVVDDHLLKRFADLLQPRETHRTFRKHERLRKGFVPHAIAFSTLVDLRPDFADQDDELNVLALLPTIQLRITLDTDSSQPFVCQLTVDALAELKLTIDRLEKKLLAVQNMNPLTNVLAP